MVHPWLERATAYCWHTLPKQREALRPDDAIAVLTFLAHVPDREVAGAEFGRLGQHILAKLVALDPGTPGYVKSPLDFAPQPGSLARQLFDGPTIERHLDALAARQEADGGWPISWEPPSPAAVHEWRAYMTIKWLTVLKSYDRDLGQAWIESNR